MHWPSRRKKEEAPVSDGAASKEQQSSSQSSSAGEKKSIQPGQFDPDELERGATALKAIDESKHSAWAFELARMQEGTVQLGHQKAVEEQKSNRMQLESQLYAVQADEQRKTTSHMADAERHLSQYKAQIEHQLQGNKLELQQAQLDYQMKREMEQFGGHEQIRMRNEAELEEVSRETMRMKAKFDQFNAVSGAKADAEGAAAQERQNIEIRLRELRASSAEDRRSRLESIDEVMGSLSSGAQALYEDPSKGITAVAGLTMLALGVYSARAATRVASTVLERNLGRPPLVRETSRWTWRPNIEQWKFWRKKEGPNIFQKIVLEEELAQRLQWSTNALISAQENGTPFRHLLLHGKPGTGKTLFARTLAKQCGLDYAIMSGGDIGPLGKEAPHELHKMFGWAQNSKRGLVLFVDEADAFLRRGRAGSGGMSEDARNALSVFLHHTGTENHRVAVILATNVPGMLDRAVLDRIDEAFEFPRPAYDQRIQMLQMFMDTYVRSPSKTGSTIQVDEGIDQKFMEQIATRTEGLSGRQLAKLVLAFQSAVFGSGTNKLSVGLAETVLQWRLAHSDE